jgi:hypothetical protein
MLHACAARFVTIVFREKFLDLNTPLVIGVHGYKQIVWHVAALFKFLMKYHVLGSCPTSMACSPCCHMLIYIYQSEVLTWRDGNFSNSGGVSELLAQLHSCGFELSHSLTLTLHCTVRGEIFQNSSWNLVAVWLCLTRRMALSVIMSYPRTHGRSYSHATRKIKIKQ